MITVTEQQIRAFMASTRLDPYCSGSPRFLGVVDTNALLSSVDNDCRKGAYWRSRLLRMADGGAAVLYAADHVYAEVYRGLSRIARSSPVSLDTLRTRFEQEYLPVLRFVTVDATDIVDPQVLAITDPDDVPTGQLAKLLGSCIVLSEDRHLRRPGLAPDDWRSAAACAVDLVEATRRQYAATGNLKFASLPVTGAIELIKLVGRRTGIPPWLLGAVAVGGGAFLLKDPERRTAIGKYVGPIVQTYTKELEQATALEQRGLAGLREVILSAPSVTSAKQQVAIVLARQRQPVLANEIQERMQQHFSAELVPTIAEVRAVLKDGPEFVPFERYRWQFGRRAGAWRG